MDDDFLKLSKAMVPAQNRFNGSSNFKHLRIRSTRNPGRSEANAQSKFHHWCGKEAHSLPQGLKAEGPAFNDALRAVSEQNDTKAPGSHGW